MLFMWSDDRKKVALSGTISRQSSILRGYQELWQGRQSQSPPSPLRNHEVWRYNCATQPQWSQPAAQPIHCVGYYSRDRSGWTIQPPITGAIHPVSIFDAPNESEYHWRLGDNAHNNGRCHVLYWVWARTSLLRCFFKRHLWLQWAKKCICRFEPFLHTAAYTKTKKASWPLGCLLPKRGSVAAQLRGMRPDPNSQKDTLTRRKKSNITYFQSNSIYH